MRPFAVSVQFPHAAITTGRPFVDEKLRADVLWRYSMPDFTCTLPGPVKWAHRFELPLDYANRTRKAISFRPPARSTGQS